MSSIQSILSEESVLSRKIFLHKEGLFYVAYERSCYAFHRYIKPFKLTKRFVKSVGQEVVKLGFPVSSLEKLLQGCRYEKTSEKLITVFLNDDELINEQDFSVWNTIKPIISANIFSKTIFFGMDTDFSNLTIPYFIPIENLSRKLRIL